MIRKVVHEGGAWWKPEIKDNDWDPYLPEDLAVKFRGVEVSFEHSCLPTFEDEIEEEDEDEDEESEREDGEEE
jgi:hypothetical protein